MILLAVQSIFAEQQAFVALYIQNDPLNWLLAVFKVIVLLIGTKGDDAAYSMEITLLFGNFSFRCGLRGFRL